MGIETTYHIPAAQHGDRLIFCKGFQSNHKNCPDILLHAYHATEEQRIETAGGERRRYIPAIRYYVSQYVPVEGEPLLIEAPPMMDLRLNKLLNTSDIKEAMAFVDYMRAVNTNGQRFAQSRVERWVDMRAGAKK